jgi:hypothetical protein
MVEPEVVEVQPEVMVVMLPWVVVEVEVELVLLLPEMEEKVEMDL